MLNVEEIEVEIKKEKDALVKLEEEFENEEEDAALYKLKYKITQRNKVVDKLTDRQQALLDREAKDAEKKDPKDKNKEEEDTDVCPECGGDLILVGKDDSGITDVYECEQCRELYLDE